MSKTVIEGTASLDKALDILDAISAAPGGVSQVELSERLCLPRTTLHRMMSALMARGMIRRDSQRRVYELGFRCFELGRQTYDVSDLARAAGAELRALRDLTGESAYLAVLKGAEVLALERCDGAHRDVVHFPLGERKPLHCTSQGKAILAAMNASARDALLRKLSLQALTARTTTDMRRLRAELDLTRCRGYAIDDEESVGGIRCVGAPIIDSAGQVRGAISISGPAYRLPRERLGLLGPELAEAAGRIGAQLTATRVLPAETPQALDGEQAAHGAFPHWCGRRRTLYWADALKPAVRCRDEDGERELATLPASILGLVPHGAGLLALTAEGCWQIDPASGALHAVATATALPHSLCAGDAGLLWAARREESGRWTIGKWVPESGLHPQWRPGEAIGALCWDARQGLLYAAAPDSGAILVMRPGETVVRRLTSIPRASGIIAGIAVDPEGGVWTAMRDGWSVLRIAPDGNIDRVAGLSVPQPTDLAFGGDDLDTLYITTARHGLGADVLASAIHSGSLFRLAPSGDAGDPA
ncbi:transcriptional regulator, IclR family [Noviherbaspirillum humi]|uniref:Transcriptional regulator, IclR family n=1 Tax=Noviherbaspirillum humi TaxID=1688639 RepID=A0A239KMN5_9BURK|nr:IclR family transcriptional regulator C-terminal domain-containing protein [Noviherbaspirillum humi]SNT18893.1 transcriptional regulator, IclR family [Noviherbaspirillum humi]